MKIINDNNELIKQINEISQKILRSSIIVNSPGGTFVSSKEIHDSLENKYENSISLHERMGTLVLIESFSGRTKIFANQGTITGSIGVILQTAQLTSLMKKLELHQ